MPNGIKAEACEIRLENGEMVPIPVANFEIIE
jgi:hypothetical protein